MKGADLHAIGTLNVLLVEDDEIDRKAVRRAFGKLEIPVHIVEASDGQQALDILKGRIDINLPQMDGIEVLQALRQDTSDAHLRNAIVFVLTTSEAEKDRERAYAHNVAGYLVKSADRGGLTGIAEMLRAFREVVVFP